MLAGRARTPSSMPHHSTVPVKKNNYTHARVNVVPGHHNYHVHTHSPHSLPTQLRAQAKPHFPHPICPPTRTHIRSPPPPTLPYQHATALTLCIGDRLDTLSLASPHPQAHTRLIHHTAQHSSPAKTIIDYNLYLKMSGLKII